MANRRHLSRAPIREAIIDIRTTPPCDVKTIAKLAEALKEQYPAQQTMVSKMFGFEVAEKQFTTPQRGDGPQGMRLTDASGKHVAQLRVDGFTFSRIAPYETWEAMRAQAFELWSRFLEVAQVERVTRVAVRYINVMPLPATMREFTDYLTAAPTLPPTLPQGVGSYFMRLVVADPDTRATALITQALEAIQQGEQIPIVLDIDVFRDLDQLATSKSVWDTLDQLREFKNRVFFESITETTAELFE